jgi:hypothetical protein
MTSMLTTGRICGQRSDPDHRANITATWRTCQACRPAAVPAPDDSGSRCERCGRPLRAGTRTICARCLGVPL